MLNLYQEINNILSSGAEGAVVTIIAASRSTPRRVGAKMVVRTDGSILGTIGGGAIEAISIRLALDAIKTGEILRKHFELVPDQEPGMVCGGEMEILVEPLVQKPTIFIFGGGHIGLALTKIGKMLDFEIVVIDNRADFSGRERFPEADLVMQEDYVKSLTKLSIDKQSYIVIVTHGHRNDEQVLEQALRTPARYIGMIGSRTKIKAVFDSLSAKGFDRAALERVHAPIGLEIHAETPEEICISIMAEIIKIRREPQ